MKKVRRTSAEVAADKAARKPAPAPETKAAKVARASKQAMMIAMMRRAEGATAAQIAEETGWQNHTIRGAISTLRSKKGLPIEATYTREVGPNKVGAKGSTTVYRLPS
jgi:hypothetical protein